MEWRDLIQRKSAAEQICKLISDFATKENIDIDVANLALFRINAEHLLEASIKSPVVATSSVRSRKKSICIGF